MYAFLADLVVAIHFIYIATVLFGLLIILIGGALGWRWVRNFWFRMIHMMMIAVVVFEALLGIVCPLTTWERDLRIAKVEAKVAEARETGTLVDQEELQKAYDERSFIGRWLHDLVFVDASPTVLTYCYAGFLLLVVLSWVFVPPRRPKVVRRIQISRRKKKRALR